MQIGRISIKCITNLNDFFFFILMKYQCDIINR